MRHKKSKARVKRRKILFHHFLSSGYDKEKAFIEAKKWEEEEEKNKEEKNETKNTAVY